MKVQRYPSIGLAFLTAALALLSSNVIASTTSDCEEQYFSDGFCDDQNNNEACGFDGGDCCSCTCVSGDYDCGENIGFNCLDSSAPCFGEETSFTGNCISDFFSDGDCDLINNTDECGFDGGDCCECTCVSTADFTCGDNEGNGGFSCLDPSASCVDDDDVTTLPTTETFSDSGSTTGTITTPTSGFCLDNFISDGDCDLDNNNEDCGYDGGDCCECTCVSTDAFTCGDGSHGGFSCLDPSAPCVDDDDVTTLPTTETFTGTTITTTTTTTGGCIDSFVSDGDCDLINNTEECGYDGGDCCECTCVSTDNFTCGDGRHGGFTCLDPSAPCVDDDDATTLPTTETFTTTTSSPCIPEVASDGDCDTVNNNEECGYDGGDCCVCTCVSTRIFECGSEDHGGFACVDPRAPCAEDDDFTPGADDFYFDDDDFSASFTFEPCIDDFISDGDCDSANNNEGCGFDGGDCCECSCVSTDAFTCGQNGFNCVDPSPSCIDGNVQAIIKKEPTS